MVSGLLGYIVTAYASLVYKESIMINVLCATLTADNIVDDRAQLVILTLSRAHYATCSTTSKY